MTSSLIRIKGYRGNYYAASGLTYGYSHQLARYRLLNSVWGLAIWRRNTENILPTKVI